MWERLRFKDKSCFSNAESLDGTLVLEPESAQTTIAIVASVPSG